MENGRSDLLKGLTGDQIEEFLSLGSKVALPEGETLFALGDEAENLYLIEKGSIKLTLPIQIQDRQEVVVVDERAAGQTVGWSALTPPYRFTLKATAAQDSNVIAFSREALSQYFSANPAAGYTVISNLAAVIGKRLLLFQAMWVRQMQRMVEQQCA